MLAVAAAVCAAQTTTTGLVEGTVRDAAGRPLEGVKVRLVSGQVTRTASTGPAGRFYAGLLNPGEWRVILEKPGFQSLAGRVTVLPEVTAPLRFRMAPVAGATVEVAAGPAVQSLDPTSTTAGTTLTRDQIDRLPVGRNMSDLAYLAPTAGFAGSGWAGPYAGVDYSISGASGIENQFITDGLVTTDFRFGGQGLLLVPEFVDSVQVESSGFKAENSALGGLFNSVLKSGSNTFLGEAWATASPARLEARAKSNPAGFRQPAPANWFDLGFDAGGALVKDRLFYFAGLDLERRSDRTEPNASGLRGDDKDTGSTQLVLKVNGYLSPEQQLAATWIATRRKESQPRAYPDGYGDARMGYARVFETRHLSLVYDHAFRSGLLLSLKAGSSSRRDEWKPEDPLLPSIQDDHWFSGGGGGDRPELDSFSYFRGGRGWYGWEQADTLQFKADLTWIFRSHAVKAGASHLAASYGREDFATGPPGDDRTYIIYSDATILNATRSGSLGGAEVKSSYQAFYLQDTWELDRRLRVICGVRAERQEHRDAAGRTRLRFTDMGRYLQPRLGLTWDPEGDGRTLLTASYAVYFEQVPQRLPLRAWGNEIVESRDYALMAYSPTGLGSFDAAHPVGGWDWEPNMAQVAPGIRLPKRQEWSLGLEKRLPRGLSSSLHVLFRHLTDGMDDSFLFDREGNSVMYTANGNVINLLWNPAPSVSFVAPAGAVDKDGHPLGGRTITVNDTLFPAAYNKYAALSLGLNQQGGRGFWSAAYTWSHLWGNFEGVATSDRGIGAGTDGNYGPGFDAWPYVGTGNLGLDRRHRFKFFGSRRWVFPAFVLNLGARWTWQSGLALSLQDDGSTTLGLPPGTLGVGNPLDPAWIGGITFDHGLMGNHGRSPSVSTADLHVDAEFSVGKLRLRPALDVYNLFNARTPTLIYQYATKWMTGEADRRYGQPAEWLQGRRLQLGLKARF